MVMGASGEISSITFDGSDVVYVLLMNESFLNIDALKENPDAMKSAVTVMFGNPQGSTLFSGFFLKSHGRIDINGVGNGSLFSAGLQS